MKKTNKKIVFVMIILIAIFCISITPITFQNDTYYTIKIGEHISDNGIDMKDPFSWHEDLDYTYPHWLYDYITYIIYSMFGFTGIYVVTCILSIVLGLSIFFIGKKISKNQIVSFFVTIVTMYLIKDQIAARAQLVSFILFAIQIFSIEKFIETKKIRYGILLLIIPILLANLHLAVFPFYFVIFLPYIAEYICITIYENIKYKKDIKKIIEFKIKSTKKKIDGNENLEENLVRLENLEDKLEKIKILFNDKEKVDNERFKIKLVKKANVKYLILIAIIALLTGLLTPLGTTPYTYLYNTMQGNTTNHINEHLPLILSESTEGLIVVVVFLAILIFTKVRITLADLFMLLGLSWLMLDSRRQLSMLVLFASFILMKLIVEYINIYKETKKTKKTKKLEENVEIKDVENKLINKNKSLKIVHNIIKCGIMIIILGVSIDLITDKFDDEYVKKSLYPVNASTYIIDNLNLDEIRLYNEYNYGSYLLFRGIPVFIDSRADLYAPEFSGLEDDIFKDYINTSGLTTYYEDTFEKYDITHVITYKNSKMNQIIEETEKRTNDLKYYNIYSDEHFVIYEILN